MKISGGLPAGLARRAARTVSDRFTTVAVAVRARCGQFFSSERGSALIEFYLVLPMMMVVVTGLFSFGVTLNNRLELTQAVGSGGQYLQTIRSSTQDPCKDVATAVLGSAVNLRPANLNLTVKAIDGSGNSTVESGPASTFSCAGAQTSLVTGGSATVAATYPCTLFVYGINMGNSCQLSAQITEFEY